MKQNSPGQVEVAFRYSRHIGPKYIHGSVTLQFDAIQPYAFVSEATWPSADNYTASIQRAVEEVLQEKQGHLKSPRVVLKRVEWDDVDSCEIGFRRAAAAATRAAFEV